MQRNRIWIALAAATAALVTTGCQPKLYRAETVLHDDGSVQRAIYQPVESSLSDAQRAGVWQGFTYAPRIAPDKWTGSIAELPAAARDKEHPYFAAWGSFESPDRLPQIYVKQAPPGLPDGKLVVQYERDDYVLVVEHRFKETLTDIVTIDDMHLARRELADLLVPLSQKILERTLGDEYDTTKLDDWLDQTATPWFFELTDVVFEAGTRNELSEEKLMAAMAPVCARRGLVLTDASGKLLDSEALENAVEAYVTRVLGENLRRRDGKQVSAAEIAKVVEWIGLKERPENSEKPYERYNKAVEKVIAEKFGDSEAFEHGLEPLVARIFGLYAGDLLGFPHDFRYTLKTPGPIVKTNGTLLSDRRVRWTFEGNDAYPFGYTMQCDSLVVQAGLEKELLGRQVLVDNETAFAYMDLLRSNPALREVMQACARAKSMAPYYKASDESGAASTSEKALDALGKMLGLPKEPAGR
jgi:hypothetical protein